MRKTKRVKKKSCGSKTSKVVNNPTNNSNIFENTTLDVNKIFDIVESDTKRKKQLKLKKSKNITPNNISDNTTSKTINNTTNTPTEKEPEIPQMKMIYEKPDTSSKQLSNNPIQYIDEQFDDIKQKSYVEAKKFLCEHGITISTITLDCKLHTLIDVDKFAKNVALREDEIVSVKFGNRKDPATNRTIIVLKPKKKPSIKNFFNQVTILMKPQNNPTRNYINIKVFQNGSLQMTGCKDMEDFNNVTNTLIDILKRGRNIKNKNKKIIHIDFIKDPQNIGIFDTRIRMINSNFKLNYKVDRKKLARLLKKHHKPGTNRANSDKEIGPVECKYDPGGGHSCVNIKYKYDQTSKPSIFVFQTGAVIITGAKNLHHIIMAYHFIQKILNRYHNQIKIVELDEDAVQAEIAKYLMKKKNPKNKKILDKPIPGKLIAGKQIKEPVLNL